MKLTRVHIFAISQITKSYPPMGGKLCLKNCLMKVATLRLDIASHVNNLFVRTFNSLYVTYADKH